MAVQTVLNSIKESDDQESTYSKLYDIDKGLIRSEKQAMLKYMRNEVATNQEFLD